MDAGSEQAVIYLVFIMYSCWSYVGRLGIGKQQISIDGLGCFTHGVAVHEIGHALGEIN